MYRIDKWMDLGKVSIFALPIPHIFFIVFMVKTHYAKYYYIDKYYTILEENMNILKNIPNIEIYKERKDKDKNKDKANNSYIRQTKHKKKK